MLSSGQTQEPIMLSRPPPRHNIPVRHWGYGPESLDTPPRDILHDGAVVVWSCESVSVSGTRSIFSIASLPPSIRLPDGAVPPAQAAIRPSSRQRRRLRCRNNSRVERDSPGHNGNLVLYCYLQSPTGSMGDHGAKVVLWQPGLRSCTGMRATPTARRVKAAKKRRAGSARGLS